MSAIKILGKMCRHGHEFENSGQSLRYEKGNCCVTCTLDRYVKVEKTRFEDALTDEQIDVVDKFNGDKKHLGPLCDRNHDYENSGLSVRYNIGNSCVECGCVRRENDTKDRSKYMAEYTKRNKDIITEKIEEILCREC